MQANARFSEHPVLTVRLVKIHGSVSWYSRGGRIFERHPESIPAGEKRVMVLPRRGKVMDTLQAPYDTLFRIMSQSLGADCKYLASCGFSFGDDHRSEEHTHELQSLMSISYAVSFLKQKQQNK